MKENSPRLGAHRAFRVAETGEQQAQEVPHLGEGAHGGAGIVQAGPLAHGHGGAQPLDGGHRGPAGASRELPGEGRQGLQEAPPALPEQGVEGQGGLAGAGDAGDHREPPPGNAQVEPLEVVLPGAADDQFGRLRHGLLPVRTCAGPTPMRGAARTLRFWLAVQPATMASEGQVSTQAPQSMQTSGSMV